MTYRNDEESALYKRIADLEEENRKLRTSAPVKKARGPVDFERLWGWLATVLAIVGFSGVTYCLVQAVRANNKVDFCYITAPEVSAGKDKNYGLYGYREWTNDLHLSSHGTLNDAIQAAEQLKCPLLRGAQ